MLMTPATASLPYCAPAPSRRISMWSMAPGGMALTSTGTVPAKLLSVSSTALAWRRLPLISTSTWSGARPRSCTPRTESRRRSIQCGEVDRRRQRLQGRAHFAAGQRVLHLARAEAVDRHGGVEHGAVARANRRW
jgi:hypothetical protein